MVKKALPDDLPVPFFDKEDKKTSMILFTRLRNFCMPYLFGFLVLACAIVLPHGANSSTQDVAGIPAEDLQAASEQFALAEYGEIIYRKNPHAPQQVYIIGQSHRSALTGQGGPDLVKVQAEIYRIGEWLILENNVEMLLPEGFFQNTAKGKVSSMETARETMRLDNQTLKDRLSDPIRFVNADLLLKANYNIPFGQVENEQLYRDISRLLHQARQEKDFSVLSELNLLQDERTAVMLQNIPDIVEEAYRTGQIGNRKAMFTIGLAHIGAIINNLQRGSLRGSAQPDPTDGEASELSLKLLDQGYGVTVIIPRTLAENQRTLRLAGLKTD
jgi:hypothetical protein